MRAVAAAVLTLFLVLGAAACGGSSTSSTSDDVCTHITNIAGQLKNLRTGVSGGQASIEAITNTTQLLKQEFQQLNESVQGLDDPNVAGLQASYVDLRRVWVGLPPGTTPAQAQTALAEPAAAVRAAGSSLADSLDCPRPS